MSTSSISSAFAAPSTSTNNDAYKSLNPDDFLKMLLAELQNQDPLDPMDSTAIVQQVSQIKAIESNQKLSDTLTTMQVQQNLVAASTLLQKTITGLTDKGDKITGQVDRVTVDNTGVKVCIGDQTISLKNIAEVDPTK